MSKGEIIHLLLLLPKPLNYTVIQNYGITLILYLTMEILV